MTENKCTRCRVSAVVSFCLIFNVSPVWSEGVRSPLSFGQFQEMPNKTTERFEPGCDYFQMHLLNVVQNKEVPLFFIGEGDSTVALFLQFSLHQREDGYEWKFAKTFDKVGPQLLGSILHKTLTPHFIPVPKLFGGYNPELSGHIIELERSPY